MNYDDIEMLEIPEDDISTSSETETISESSSSKSTTHKKFDRSLLSPNKSYISLQEWLNSEQKLDFKFDSAQYKKSLATKDTYTDSYISYVNGLYKVIESLTDNSITRVNLEYKEELIGIISGKGELETEQKYRKIDEAFLKIIENLTQFLDQIESESDQEQLQLLLSILDCLKANYFYSDIRNKPEQISTWVNRYEPKPESDLVQEIMAENPTPYIHPHFWNKLMVQLVTRGLLNEATEAIKHSKYEELSETCPELYSVIEDFQQLLSSYTSFALKGQFPQWKLTACEFRDMFPKFKANISESNHEIILNQIYDLACIITGLPKTIASHCDTWYEVYSALSFFQIRDNNELYPEFYKLSIDEKPPPRLEEADELYEIAEQCFVDIMEENFLKVLKSLHDFEPITAAVVSKFLELKGFLNNYYLYSTDAKDLDQILNKRTVSEYFLTKQAFECLNIHDLVPVGMGILLNEDVSTSKESAHHNKAVIASFLPKFHCKTNDDLEWGLTICAKLELISTARELYYVYGLKSLDDGFIFEALNMFVNCYDPTTISTDNKNEGMKQVHRIVWDLIFQDSLINNRPVNDELINNIVSNQVDENFDIHPVIRQCLSPYAVLKSFFESLHRPNNDVMSKLSKVIHLLRFSHLPKKFYPLLLSQFLPFLIDAKCEFQLPDLIVIIELIDTYEVQSNTIDLTEGEQLYKYSINHIESDSRDYDWRKIVKSSFVEVPSTIDILIKKLRNEIVSKIGQVYIEK